MLTTQELLPVVLTLAAIVATYFYLNTKSNVWASHSNHKSPSADHFQFRGNIKPQSVQEFQAYRKDSNIAQYLKVSSRRRC